MIKERGMCMKKKKGISLIVLIVTIIVIIILAVAVILTITKNNPIESAKEAVFKEDVRAFQDELNMYISNEYTRLQGQRDIKITAKGYGKDGEKDSVYTYIPDFKKKYEGKLAIKDDMIAYVGSDAKEKEWLLNSGVYIAKTLTVKYVDQDGNKLKEDESIALMDNYYSVDVPEIEGYIRFSEKLEGKISQDIEVIAEYYLENDNLAFMGLDASGNETTDEASIVSYEVTGIGECNVSKIAIPREHNSKPVTKIKENAFQRNAKLKGVVIGDNIENIGRYAFCLCMNLTQANINAKNLDIYAFRDNSNLSKVIIGKNVSNMNEAIFQQCSKLNDFTIQSDNVNINNMNIGNGTSSLKEIKVNEGNSKYSVEDGVLLSKDGAKIYCYPTGKEGDSYTISKNITEIGTFSFDHNKYLKTINIPDNVNLIGIRAFDSCANLTEVYLNAKKVDAWGFRYNYKLEKVTIGENVSQLVGGTFDYCNKLKDFTLLSSKVNINNNNIGFSTSSLKEIKVNEDNSKYIFENGILYSKDKTKIYAYLPENLVGAYTVPSNVTEIGDYAFYGCNKLTSINVPETVNKYGLRAIGSCSNLIEVSFNSKDVGMWGFRDNYKLEKVIIGSNVKSFGSSIFQGSNKVNNITYLGTVEEWKSSLGKTPSLWKNGNTSINKIICADGEITL